ncbi:Eco57I restriction-modification methylase domain-containing protein [Micromonospora sp. BQ11]|uniref:Eco57I restriction-modification methylase domain-containing protein n=1 Tax=Micromonospora sp. BQ11 TaxID=3452212 RepID=UPI003F8CAE89
MAFNSITNNGEYISDHYLASLLKYDLEGLRKRWSTAQKAAALNGLPADVPATSAHGIKALGQRFYTRRNEITEQLGEAPTVAVLTDARIVDQTRDLNDLILRALAFDAPTSDTTTELLRRTTLDVVQLDQHRQVEVALAATGPGGLELVALDATWAESADGIVDTTGGCRLLSPIKLDGGAEIDHAGKAVEFLFAGEDPPRYVLLLTGNVVLLADRSTWPRSYLAVNLTQALHTKDDTPGGELETIAALFGAESLITYEGQNALAALVDQGYKHAVKVSRELREALRQSVELIAQEILDRIREQGADPDDLGDKLARRLTEQSLRYLYRILFLLYAEARPELGILPSKNEAYQQGYGLARLADTVSVDLPEEAKEGLYFHHSLSLLFTLVDEGHQHRPAEVVLDDDGNEIALDTDGIRFEALKSELFYPDRTALIGERVRVGQCTVDTRLRNECLWQVLNLLMLSPEPTGRRGRGRSSGQRGFISYAQLGINQLGAVYEGLMSYSGFFATEDVYEVANTVKVAARTADGEEKEKADPSKGTWTVPVARSGDFDPKYFVMDTKPITGESGRVIHRKGSFVYRLSGRERQRSASYYTPEVLTQCTVRHALAELLTEQISARDILDLTICEPALGSGAFLNEAINQLADAYLDRAQHERGERLLPDRLEVERQKVKAYLALHNCYGVDLNATAVELAEVSIWLNVMHAKLEAPWFGLHLRRGNSLVGARRAVYPAALLSRGVWRTTPPTDRSMACDANGRVIDRLADDEIHHFLLPAQGWGAVADTSQAREFVPAERAELRIWRQKIRNLPNDKKTKDRLLALAQRVERLWELTRKRIAISEQEIRRTIDVWGVDPARPLLRPPSGAVARDEITMALYADRESPYNRLKTVMDAWCALWFWPVGQGTERISPPTIDEWLSFCEAVLGIQPTKAKSTGRKLDKGVDRDDVLGIFGVDYAFAQMALEEDLDRSIAQCVPAGRIAVDHRFGWWAVLNEIAEREGFFHWELEFAQIFAKGGFDLQVGNPPWVRPEWSAEEEFAEFDASAMFGSSSISKIRETVLSRSENLQTVCDSFTGLEVVRAYTSDPIYYPQLGKSAANLYKNFLINMRRAVKRSGVVGFVHPPGHMTDVKSVELRRYLYPQLVRLWSFTNQLKLFEEIGNTRPYAIAVYRPGREGHIDFTMATDLLDPRTLEDSLSLKKAGGGSVGEPPGMKLPDGKWDLRPHATRIVEVRDEQLRAWSVFSHSDASSAGLRLMQPHTTIDAGVLERMAAWPHKLRGLSVRLSPGLMEGALVDAGVLRKQAGFPSSLGRVFLQGAHFNVHDPYYQQTQPVYKNHRSYERVVVADIQGRGGVRRTTYQFHEEDLGMEVGVGGFRVFFLRWVDLNGERTLQAALMPPGPSHSDVISALSGPDDELTLCLVSLNSVVLDYLAKSGSDVDVRDEILFGLPVPRFGALWGAVTLRAMRLNCRGPEYAEYWNRNYSSGFLNDTWTTESLELLPLGEVRESWSLETPLNDPAARRQAQLELDALVALGFGLSSEELEMLYRSKFPVLEENDRRFVSSMGQDSAESELTRIRLMGSAHREFQRRLDAGEYPDVMQP